jgi:subtilisin family serine protease
MSRPVYRNYIILPKPGNRFSDAAPRTDVQESFSRLKPTVRLDDVLGGNLSDQSMVIDSTDGGGAKLIRIPESDLPSLRARLPGLRIVPEVFYYPQRWHHEVRSQPARLAGQAQVTVRIRLAEAKTGAPVAGALVIAFTNFDQREGEQATSDAKGVVSFRNIGNRPIDQLFVYPKVGYWSFWRKKLTLTNNTVFDIQPVKLDYTDAKRFFYPPTAGDELAGQGVNVGVIDTGAGPHPDLTLAGGACTVTG